MRETSVRRSQPAAFDPLRLVSGGVLLLHVLAALAVLMHLRAQKALAPEPPPMMLLKAEPETRAALPSPVPPPRIAAPPSALLRSPVFIVTPGESHSITLPAAPPAGGPGASGGIETKKPGELFSDEKKEAFKAFFKRQAIEDRAENAKPAAGSSACDLFRAQNQPKMPDMQTSPSGIARTFIPAIGIGIGGSDDGKSPVQACN